MTRLVLASRSPARLAVLRAAGVDPYVRVSGVDEGAVAAALGGNASHEGTVTALADAKATVVAESLVADIRSGSGAVDFTSAVVVGCDSMLSLDDFLAGKPADVDTARIRWSHMAGRSGRLLTGHCVIRIVDGAITDRASDHSSTTVTFGTPTADDLEAYLATGEPLEVAGAFTLDGLGGWFVERIDGDPSSVIGIGLPLVRRLLAGVGITVAELWSTNAPR
ncbi:Maf-like protein [Rhodococcoides trifolii]|uniref:Nucleoside triphosphate pyrophosphatase n=1 Tax=Rhodococcoides trifolii TaxID=908250 RepID=A0A917D6Y0_9NOCA|nr:Maf family protein [Rhodococcus trifolii]GGG12925.1 Maf-like protein [Rhodococcus trifolii]